LFHDRIERIATWALNAQEMPLPPATLGFTIVAHDIYHSLQICGHGVFRNVSGSGFPGCRHALLTHDRLFANRATVIKASQFSEAMGVNCVSAR
jgi:hypothetical protein